MKLETILGWFFSDKAYEVYEVLDCVGRALTLILFSAILIIGSTAISLGSATRRWFWRKYEYDMTTQRAQAHLDYWTAVHIKHFG